MANEKAFLLSTVLWFITICVVGVAHGGWNDPPWADLPKLEYIYDSDDTIWFYSTLEVGGFPPRYVVTYEKQTRNISFHPISSKKIPEDAPLGFRKSKQLPSDLHVEPRDHMKPRDIIFKGTRIAVPELTLEETKRLREWSACLQDNRRFPLTMLTLSNALQGSFIEVNGTYYCGMEGGIAEAYGHLGGLVVYRPPDEECTILRSKYLVDCSITDIVRIGDELAVSTLLSQEGWVGPGAYWENGASYKVGLVLYNINTGKWRHIPIEDLDIIIRGMSVIDGSLWMITNYGVSHYQPDTDKMRNWCWSLSLVER